MRLLASRARAVDLLRAHPVLRPPEGDETLRDASMLLQRDPWAIGRAKVTFKLSALCGAIQNPCGFFSQSFVRDVEAHAFDEFDQHYVVFQAECCRRWLC